MMHLLHSDRSLVGRTLRGDREAFGGLVERYRGSVYAVALAVSRNHAEAEDAAQDAFLKAFESLPGLREPKRFGPWVAHIARNLCRDRLRAAQRRQELAPETAAAADPVETIAREDVHALLREQVGRLDEVSREVLTLYYYGGRNTREIAGLLEIGTAAAKKRLERARAALGKQLLEELGGAGVKKEDEAAHLKRILLALSATTPAWFAGATEAAAVALSAGAVAKIAAGLAVAAATVSVGAMLATQSRSNPTGAVGGVAAPPEAAAIASESLGPITLAANDDPEIPPTAVNEARTAEPDDGTRALAVDLAGLERAMAGALNKPVSISMEDTHVSEILGFLAKYMDFGVITLSASPEAAGEYATDGMLDSVDFENLPLQTALEQTLWPLGLDLAVEPGYVWVSTPERIRALIGRPSAKETERLPDAAKLATPVTVTLADVHVSAVADYLSELAEINVLLDYRVIQHPPKRRPMPASGESPFATPPSDPKAEAEASDPKPGYVPYVNLMNVMAVDALRGIFRMIDFEYRPMPGYVIVGPKGTVGSIAPDHDYVTRAFAPEVAAWLEADAVIALDGREQRLSHLAAIVEESGKAALGDDFAVRLAAPALARLPTPSAAFAEGVPMAVALDGILGSMGLSWSMEGHSFVIQEGAV